MSRLNKSNIDVSRCFLMFCSTIGDCEKTGAALDIDPEVVRKLAKEEGWHTKIERLSMLHKSGNPGDYAKSSNRALNWIMAHQTRELIMRILEEVRSKDVDEILEMVSSVAKDGSRHVSGRFFADLTAAMDKAASISYAALGDTCGERKEKEGESEPMSTTEMHLAVMQALNRPQIKAVDILKEVDKELDGAQKQIADSTSPAPSSPAAADIPSSGPPPAPRATRP